MTWFSFKKKNSIPAPEASPAPELFPFLIPAESVIHGSIEASVPCRLEGCIEGDVTVKGTLIVSEAAEVWGNISCDDAVIYGKVWRNISCTNKATICSGGYVEGVITAAVLDIDEQAVVRHSILEPEEEEVALYDTNVSAVISPLKVLVNESTWF